MFRLGKKGTEKPIEIFVALFIILAVSMIMLKMFQGQITEKTAEMKGMQRETDLLEKLDNARIKCKELCANANEEGCPDRAISAYCMRKFEGLDLDGDLETDGYDKTLMAGIGVCEQSVLCPMLTECKCGKDLDLKTCRDIMCGYWEGQGISVQADRTSMLTSAYASGGCYDPTATTDDWHTILFSGAPSCPP